MAHGLTFLKLLADMSLITEKEEIEFVQHKTVITATHKLAWRLPTNSPPTKRFCTQATVYR